MKKKLPTQAKTDRKSIQEEQKHRFSIYLPVSLHKRLKIASAERELSMAEIIIHLLEKDLK